MEALAACARAQDADVLCYGDTHENAILEYEARCYVNPGSLTGAPRSYGWEGGNAPLPTVTPSFTLMSLVPGVPGVAGGRKGSSSAAGEGGRRPSVAAVPPRIEFFVYELEGGELRIKKSSFVKGGSATAAVAGGSSGGVATVGAAGGASVGTVTSSDARGRVASISGAHADSSASSSSAPSSARAPVLSTGGNGGGGGASSIDAVGEGGRTSSSSFVGAAPALDSGVFKADVASTPAEAVDRQGSEAASGGREIADEEGLRVPVDESTSGSTRAQSISLLDADHGGGDPANRD